MTQWVSDPYSSTRTVHVKAGDEPASVHGFLRVRTLCGRVISSPEPTCPGKYRQECKKCTRKRLSEPITRVSGQDYLSVPRNVRMGALWREVDAIQEELNSDGQGAIGAVDASA